MIRPALALALSAALSAAPAAAAERSVAIPSFDRIRVEGPVAVRLTTRSIPLAAVAGDPRGGVIVRVEGGTLIVRSAVRPGVAGAVPMVSIQTRDLRSAAVSGGAQLDIAGAVAGQRIMLSITGRGTLSVPGLQADELAVTLIGDGQLALGGTARSARLLANGGGAIAAEPLTVGDVSVRTEGPVAVAVTARYTATANSTGAGPITILGKPDCKVKANGGGAITCFNAPVQQ